MLRTAVVTTITEDMKWKWPFHLTMTSEQKEVKQQRIEEMKQEEVPTTLFAKVKYYFKRYWYIAVPAHMVSCTGWFITFYALVHSGVDVIALLQALHVPDLLVEQIKNTPPSAGVFVIALQLYKDNLEFSSEATNGKCYVTFEQRNCANKTFGCGNGVSSVLFVYLNKLSDSNRFFAKGSTLDQSQLEFEQGSYQQYLDKIKILGEITKILATELRKRNAESSELNTVETQYMTQFVSSETIQKVRKTLKSQKTDVAKSLEAEHEIKKCEVRKWKSLSQYAVMAACFLGAIATLIISLRITYQKTA